MKLQLLYMCFAFICICCSITASSQENALKDIDEIASWKKAKRADVYKHSNRLLKRYPHHRQKRGEWGWCWTFWNCPDDPPDPTAPPTIPPPPTPPTPPDSGSSDSDSSESDSSESDSSERGDRHPTPQDTDGPVLTNCPDVASEFHAAAGETTVRVTWNVPRANDRSGVANGYPKRESPSLNPGDNFPAGSYTIRYIAKDNNGNYGSCPADEFRVIVTKCIPPPQPVHGDVICNNMQPLLGDTCQFTCDPGYQLEDPEHATQTCSSNENVDGIGYYTPAVDSVNCIELECPVPVLPHNVEFEMCTNGFHYGSTCQYDCRHNSMLEEGSVRIRTCQANQTWSSHIPICIDFTPPVLENCPDSFTVYTEIDQRAYVDYMPPTAVDNLGNSVEVNMTSGLAPDQYVEINRIDYPNNNYLVWYTAVDSNGIETQNPCTFNIHVAELACPLLNYTQRLITECDDPLVYGAHCTFQCDHGYPLIGASEVYCEKTDADPPTAYWDWRAYANSTYCGVVECPDLHTPLNGAMSCVNISTGEYCTMSCNSNYNIPRTVSTTGEFVCDDSAGWLQDTNVPDCTQQFRASSMRMSSEFVYYNGDCTEQSVIDLLKESVIARLNSSSFLLRCTRHPDCRAENVEVTCGETTKKKKKSISGTARINFDFIIAMVNPDDLDVTDFYNGLETQLYDMYDAVFADMEAGDFDIEGFILDTRTYAEAGPTLVCPDGAVPSYITLTCRLCPTGTYYDYDLDDCQECPLGTYQDNEHQYECITCDDGYSTRTEGSRTAENCTKLCDAGSQSTDGFVSCIQCPLNTYQTSIGQTSCMTCPEGSNTTAESSTSLLDCRFSGDDDFCQNDTCNGHGLCVLLQGIHTYRCICVHGYSGDNCTIPPDPCIHNLCFEGSTCESAVTTYACSCPEGRTGVFCELEIVDGGWGDIGDWEQCSVSCGTGTRSRIRLCNNPSPENIGDECVGESIITEDCFMDDCPVCPDLRRPYGSILDCNQIGEEIVCDIQCRDSTTNTVDFPMTLNCGPDTEHVWNPDIPTEGLPKCVASSNPETVIIRTIVEYYEISNADTENAINNIEAHIMGVIPNSECMRSGACELQKTVEMQQTAKRKRRTASYDVLVTIIVILNPENLATVTYLEYIDDMVDLAYTLNNASEDGTFDFTIGGITYNIDPFSFLQSGDIICPGSMVSYGAVCGNCPPGSYSLDGVCKFCEIGSYQDQEGQISCILCQTGYTTAAVGSESVRSCNIVAEGSPTTPSILSGSSTATNFNIGGGKFGIILGLSAASVALISVGITGVLIYLCCCKNTLPKMRRSRSMSSASVRPSVSRTETPSNIYISLDGAPVVEEPMIPLELDRKLPLSMSKKKTFLA